ncbi:MAG: PQQ-binding-like beta-propeller repeat protein [bacterium]|nr:PQQ-binding-like beta-propeller repeat protein [bacterium]
MDHRLGSRRNRSQERQTLSLLPNCRGARWTRNPDAKPKEDKYGAQKFNRVHAITLAKDRLYAVHEDGRLKVLSTTDGNVVDSTYVPAPAWDGMAIAENRLYLTTPDGELVCLGK